FAKCERVSGHAEKGFCKVRKDIQACRKGLWHSAKMSLRFRGGNRVWGIGFEVSFVPPLDQALTPLAPLSLPRKGEGRERSERGEGERARALPAGEGRSRLRSGEGWPSVCQPYLIGR